MKRFFGIGLLAIMALTVSVACKDGRGSNDKDQLQNVELSEGYFAPSELKYTLDSPDHLFDGFFPIGWSKDGKFAYITEPADEAAGLYFFEISIMDVAENRIVWEWKPESDDLKETGSVAEMWESHKELFTQKLKEYGIVQQKEFKYMTPTFTFKGENYDIDSKVVENDPESENYYIGIIKSSEYVLRTSKEEKVVFKNEYEEFSGVLSEHVCGVIISPFEDRAVAVGCKMMRGYEGPPHVMTFILFNAGI